MKSSRFILHLPKKARSHRVATISLIIHIAFIVVTFVYLDLFFIVFFFIWFFSKVEIASGE